MKSQEKVELDLLIVAQNAVPRELRELRLELFGDIEQELSGGEIELSQAPNTRSIDPAVIGAIGVVLLPIVANKLGDILVEWTKRHKECSIKMKVPVPGADAIEISYDLSDFRNCGTDR